MADTPPQLTPQQQAQVQDFLRRHPDAPKNTFMLQAWLERDPAAFKEWIALNRSMGLGKDDQSYVIDPSTGQLKQNASLGKFLVTGALIVGGTLAGGYGLAALGSGGAAIPAAGTYAGDFAGTGTGIAAGGAEAGGAAAAAGGASSAIPAAGTYAGDFAGTGTGVATGGGAGGFSGFVNSMGGYRGLAGIGTNLVGSYLQSRAANNATDAQSQAARDALAFQSQEFNTNTGLNVAQANQNTQAYNTTVANLAPYRGIGAGAASLAGYSLGIPGYEQGNRTVVNAPPPVVPVQPLAVPPPVSVNGQPGQAMPNQAYLPTNQITNGQPQMSTGNSWSPSSPTQGAPRQPQVGEQRTIQGQLATWDGRGWKAAQQQGAA